MIETTRELKSAEERELHEEKLRYVKEKERYKEARKKFEEWAQAKGLDKNSDEYKERLKKLKDGYKKRRKLAKRYEFQRGWPGGPFARGLIAFNDFLGGRHTEHIREVRLALIIFGLGAVISIILGSLMLFFAFSSLILQQLMPPAKQKLDAKGEKTDEWENLGTAYLRSVFKCAAIVLFALGIGQTNLPFANILLMLVALGGYATMTITYEPKRPDQLVESFIRFGFLGVLVIPFFIFGQIFGSVLLGVMALLFFAIPPIKVGGETEAVERSFVYQVWKPIFLFGMLYVLIASGIFGQTFLGLPTWGLTGSLQYIFIYIWIISFLAGIFSSPESLPNIGMIVLILTTVIFGLGPGAQNMGIALFGQWWPTIHNTVSEFTKPLGDLFYQLGQTFGQTFFLLTNPTGFAQQITEGTYVENPTGLTGAYGLEINNLQVDNIYVGEPFSIRFELSNKGAFDARNVELSIWTNVEDFEYLKDETEETKDLLRSKKPEKVNHIDWYKYNYKSQPFAGKKIFRQDIKPIFLFGKIGCEGQAKIKKLLGITTGGGASIREKFIPFRVNVKYDYEVYSNLDVEILSQQEWDSRVRSGLLQRGQKVSRISTAPVKLSIGAMDQPIREGLPMFIGFNMSSEEGLRSKIGKAKLRAEFPDGFLPEDVQKIKCTEKKNEPRFIEDKGKVILEWELEEDEPKDVFCFFPAPEIDAPSKTFVISASANYTFERWERKDTLVNFLDACERGETEAVATPEKGDAEYCKSQGRCKEVGEGGCFFNGGDYCDDSVYKPPRDDQYVTALKCYKNVNQGRGACCPGEGHTVGTEKKIEGVTDEQCQAAFDAWMEGKNETEILKAMWAAS